MGHIVTCQYNTLLLLYIEKWVVAGLLFTEYSITIRYVLQFCLNYAVEDGCMVTLLASLVYYVARNALNDINQYYTPISTLTLQTQQNLIRISALSDNILILSERSLVEQNPYCKQLPQRWKIHMDGSKLSIFPV